MSFRRVGSSLFTIGGNFKPFTTSLSKAQGKVFSFQRRVTGAFKSLTAFLRRWAFFAGVALVVAMGKATAAAIEFEEKTAELAKLFGRDIAGPLAQSIRQMANVLPVAQAQLLEVAAEAGRLGIQGTENIKDFTRVMAEIGVTSKLTAEEAAGSIARILAAIQAPASEARSLGDVFTILSKSVARDMREIVSATQRAAPTLALMGASGAEAAAFGATLAEVSASAARAGTRIRRLAQEIGDIKNVDALASALGLTVAQFERMRDTDPSAVIVQIAAKMREGRRSADEIKTALGSAAETAAGAFGQVLFKLRRNLDLANRAMRDGGELAGEFAEKSQTTGAQVQVFKNRFLAMGQALGDVIKPAFKDLVILLGSNSDAFRMAFTPAAETAAAALRFVAKWIRDTMSLLIFLGSLAGSGGRALISFMNIGAHVFQAVMLSAKIAFAGIASLFVQFATHIVSVINKIPLISGALDGTRDALQELADGLGVFATEDGPAQLAKHIEAAGEEGENFNDIMDGIVERAVAAADAFRVAWNDSAKSLVDMGKKVDPALTAPIQGFRINTMQLLTDTIPRLKAGIESVMSPLTASTVFDQMVEQAKWALPQVQEITSQMRDLIHRATFDGMSEADFLKAGVALQVKLKKIFEQFSAQTKDFGETMKEQAAQLGTEIVRGIIDGIESAQDFLFNVLKAVTLTAVNFGIKQALGIASPSRVTAEYGKQIVMGLVMGMKSMEPMLARTALSIARTAVVNPTSLSGVPRAGGRGLAGAAAGGGPVVQIVNENKIEALSLSDARRQIPALQTEIARTMHEVVEKSDAFRRLLDRRR